MLTQLAIAIGLAADCFAVSVCIGMSQNSKPAARKGKPGSAAKPGRACHNLNYYLPALSFGLFQAGMAGIGYLAGSFILPLITNIDHWIAFFLLAYVGAKMAYSSIKDGSCPDMGNGLCSILMVSIATSIDALAVGISLAFIATEMFSYLSAIGIVAFLLSVVGLKFGHRLGEEGGKWSGVIGGIVLLAIGFDILLTHLGLIA